MTPLTQITLSIAPLNAARTAQAHRPYPKKQAGLAGPPVA